MSELAAEGEGGKASEAKSSAQAGFFKAKKTSRSEQFVAGMGALPEINYLAFTAANFGKFLGEVPAGSYADKQAQVLFWNYLDGLGAAVVGAQNLREAYLSKYRREEKIAKGIFNIASGVQLFAFSHFGWLAAISGGTFSLPGGTDWAGYSFAGAMGVDFIIATMDFHHAHKMSTFSGWLQEKTQELLAIRGDGLEKEAERQKILNEIILRCRVNNSARNRIDFMDVQLRLLQGAGLIREDIFATPATLAEIQRDREIQAEQDRQFRLSAVNLVVKAASFTGMTMQAIDPAGSTLVGEIGTDIVYAVAACYLVKYAYLLLQVLLTPSPEPELTDEKEHKKEIGQVSIRPEQSVHEEKNKGDASLGKEADPLLSTAPLSDAVDKETQDKIPVTTPSLGSSPSA